MFIKKWKKSVMANSEKMLKIAMKRCNENGISASYHITYGNIANEILNFAKRKNISLIVIGRWKDCRKSYSTPLSPW